MKLYFAGLVPKEFDFVRKKREDYAPMCGSLCTFYDISDNRLNDLVAASKGEYVFKPRGKKAKEKVLKSSGIEDEMLSQDEAHNTPELDSCASKPLKKKKKKKKKKGKKK